MPDTILRTRLYRPKITSDIIIRKELLEKLENNTDRPLTLVSAPAGYGKSTIVSSWIEFYNKKAAWVSIDDNNKDFTVFINYIIEAVYTLFPETLIDIKKLITSRELPPLQHIANILSNDLDKIHEHFILVLDDFHRITDENITILFDILLQHPAVNMHLVIISRKDPGLPLYEFRTGNKINEIRARDLRFSSEETNLFFEKIYGQKFESTLVNIIDQKIDGWAAGLRIFSSAVDKIDDIKNNLSESNIEKFFTLDHMVNRFLEARTVDGQEFLLKSSILEKFCPPLCDYVCFNKRLVDSESRSRQYMEWMEQANLFTIPLDDQKYWYRFHHLFRNVLHLHATEKYGADEVFTLHLRAGEWFADNNMLEEAISHYIKGKSVEKAVELFARHRIGLQHGKQWPKMQRLLNLFPADAVGTNPELAFSNAWVMIYQGKTLDMFEKLPHLESLLKNMKSIRERSDNLTGELYVLQAFKIYNVEMDYHNVHDLTHTAIEKLDSHNLYALGLAWIFFGGAHQTLGKSSDAVDRIYKEINETSPDMLRMYLYLALHYIYFLEGDFIKLIACARRSLNMAEEQNDYESQANSGYFLGTALYTQNKISEALIVLERAYSVRFHTLGIHHFNIACVLCYCYLVNDEYEKASKIIEELGEYTVSTNNPYMILLKEVMEAEVNWRTESEGKAFTWINKNVDIPFFPFTNFFVPQLTQIKLLIYKNDTKSLSKAEALLEKAEQLLLSTHNQFFKIDVFALQSILYFEQGNEEEAFKKLLASLQLAEIDDVIRVYLDMGPKMANLLNKLSKRETSVRFIVKILTAFKEKEINKMSVSDNKSGSDEVRKLDSIPGDNLTGREYEILTLMAHHLQNKEIGEKLFISPGTVKKHISRIYHKLHVDNRRKAVEKARALGLI